MAEAEEKTVEEKPVAKKATPTKKAAPAPKPAPTSGEWKEKGFSSPAAYDRYKAKFSVE